MAISDLDNITDDEKKFEEFKTKLLSEGKTTEFTPDWYYDRIYKNRQFAEKFGIDYFNAIPDYQQRDRLFQNVILEEELSRYKDDPNIDKIRNMTQEGQIDLFKSGYLTPEETSKEYLSNNAFSDKNKESTWDALINKGLKNAATRATEGFGGGAILGGATGLAGGIFAPITVAAGTAAGAAIGSIGGFLYGIGETAYDAMFNSESLEGDIKAINNQLLQDAYAKDVNRKRDSEAVQNLSNQTQSALRDRITSQELSYDDIDKMFESIVGNQGTEDNPVYGSNYYEAFKDSYLKDISTDEKLKLVSDFIAMNQLYPQDALTGIDQMFQDKVDAKQGFIDNSLNLAKQFATGFVSDVAMIPVDLIGMGMEVAEEIGAIDKGSTYDFLNSGWPAYINKMSKYNLWTPSAIDKAEALGGVSDSKNIIGSNESIWNWDNMIYEALGQSHYLAYYAALGHAFGAISKLKNINMSSPTGRLYGASSIVVPNMSMSAQMGYEAFEKVQEQAMAKYDSMVGAELESRVQEELNKVDWNKQLEEYKKQGLDNGARALGSDEEILEALKGKYTEQLINKLNPEIEAKYADVLNQAKVQAVDAFRMETIMDLLKNSLNTAAFRTYIFNNNPDLKNSLRNLKGVRFEGNKAIAPKKSNYLFAKVAGKEIGGEALDEYEDALTSNMAAGYNLAQFDNYVKQKEDPNSVNTTNMLFAGLSGMAMGIKNAANKDALYESVLGGISPIMPMIPFAQRGTAKPGKTWRPFMTNAIYEEYVSELEKQVDIEKRIAGINKFIEDNQVQLSSLAESVSRNAKIQQARLTGDEKKLRDAEQEHLTYLASLMYESQEASDAEVVQQMNDKIEKLVNDSYDDEEKIQLGNEFVNQAENQGLGMTAEEGYAKLVENAKKLKEASQKYAEVRKKIDKHPNSKLFSLTTKRELAEDALKIDDWEGRLDKLTSELGIGSSHSLTVSPKALYSKEDAENTVADTDSEIDNINKAIEGVSLDIKDSEDKVKTLKDSKAKDKDTLIQKEKSRIAAMEQARAQLEKQRDRAKGLRKDAASVSDNWSDENRPVLSSEEILSMGAHDILHMINNRNNYSPEQRAQIDKAASELSSKYYDYKFRLEDAVDISKNIEAAKLSSAAIKEAPLGFQHYAILSSIVKQKAQQEIQSRRLEQAMFKDWDRRSASEILEGEGINRASLDKYLEYNPGRRSEFEGVSEVIDLQDNLISQIDDTIQAPQVIVNSIKGITGIARNKAEAVNLLNNAIKDSSVPIETRSKLEHLLNRARILDAAASATLKQDKDQIAKREEEKRKADEYFKKLQELKEKEYEAMADTDAQKRVQEAESKRAKEEAKREGTVERKPEEIVDEAPREVAAEVIQEDDKEAVGEADRMADDGREPVEYTAEEEIDLGDIPFTPDGSKVVDNTDQKLEEATKEGTITDVSVTTKDTEDEKVNSSDKTFIGNRYYRYIVDRVSLILKNRITTGNLKLVYDWLDAANIKHQEVVDNELLAISALKPEVRVLKVNSRINATNDNVMRFYPLFVVEYTDEIAKIHKGEDSILKANGKKWLVIGGPAYVDGNATQKEQYQKLTDTKGALQSRANNYFRNNPGERFYIDDVVSTRIADIGLGMLIKGSEIQGQEVEPSSKPVSEILKGTGKSIHDMKWAIEKREGTAIVGGVAEDNVVKLNNSKESPGTVYLLVPAANGKYILSPILPVFSDELKEGSALDTKIKDSLRDLVNPDYNKRRRALAVLSQYLYLDGRDNYIDIGTSTNSTLTIAQNGKVISYKLNDPNTSVATVMSDVSKSRFRVQVSVDILNNRRILSMYDEAGALLTDLNKFGTVNASFNVYNIDNFGNPIMSDAEETVTTIAPVTVTPESQRTYKLGIEEYKETSNGWSTVDGKPVTSDETIQKLKYMKEITSGKKPDRIANSYEVYVFDPNPDKPIIVQVTKKTGSLSILKNTSARMELKWIESEKAEKAREEAVQSALQQQEKKLDSEETVAPAAPPVPTDIDSILDEEETDTSEPDTTEEDKPELEKTDPNKLNKSTEQGIASLEQVVTEHIFDILDIIDEKGWSDAPENTQDLIKWLVEVKGMEPIIMNADEWINNLRSCVK